MRNTSLLALTFAGALVTLPLRGQEAAPVPIGSKVADLTFVDIRYLRRSLSELGEAPATVLFFVTTSCPLVGRMLPRVRLLAERLEPKGVRFVAVNIGRGDSIVEMQRQAIETDIDFPFVKDFDGEVLRGVGVDRTCTAVVLDGERRLRYRGRVDGSFRFSGPSPTPGRADLELAIEDVLAGREVAVPSTPVEGCRVRLRPPSEPSRQVTYSRDIAPLVQEHCQICHHDGGEAPFALMTYDDCADRADMIAEVVRQRRMPPWYASAAYGHFENARGLSADERRTVVGWVLGGMERGDPADEPPPRSWPEREWRIDQPDLVLKVPVPIRVPAEGYIPYRYYVLPYRFQHDTWVQGIEILPSNKRVLHHANLAYVESGLHFDQNGFITGQVPGGRPMALPPGIAVRIPKGATLGLQCHYVTTGKPEVDHLRVGIRYARGTVRQELHHLIVNDRRFEIPPGAMAHRVEHSRRLRQNAVGVGLFAHMHLRGRDMTFRAIYPDGREETLLMIPNYSFDWQDAYVWKPGTERFPAGTRIDVIAHYDNSRFNPFNPDPDVPVHHGPQTIHEMMYGFLFYLVDGEDLDLNVDPETGWVSGA